ncbi:S41 family peptidase [Paenibacillus turpanensis]|uniref:S41 family peptidase n=1 Tax=Paenibacillus turpanensis TaxID=2689078 RepID=UPI00140C035D|nr:S41 family peptidase [Paenibacillus turpanensis]
MNFKGRTVVAFVLLAMFASSIVTLTIVGASGASVFPQEISKPANASASLSSQEVSKLNTVLGMIQNEYIDKIERDKLLDGAISGMLAALGDPHSVYMDKEAAKSFEETLESSFSGIGAEVTMKDNRVTIMSPIKGSPAEKAGIHAGDVIISVNDEKLDGLALTDAVKKIRGPKGTQAKLQVIREGSTEPISITVVRDDIDVETVYAEILPGTRGIGKIEIRQFAQNTGKRFHEELARLESEGMKGLIIDVRTNPGGILPVVADMVNTLIPKGKTIVQVESRKGAVQKTEATGAGKPYPIAVLINKGSASASEILAAAVKESGGGLLIGETTFGKGSVQSTHEMSDGSNVKLTIAKWLTPDGNWIDQKGIEPDIAVEQPEFFFVSPLPENPNLKLDANSEEVRSLQQMLQGIGYNPGREDGYFHKQTEEAVRRFQSKEGLPATGVVDQATAKKLQERVIEAIRDPKNDTQLNEAIKQVQKLLGAS